MVASHEDQESDAVGIAINDSVDCRAVALQLVVDADAFLDLATVGIDVKIDGRIARDLRKLLPEELVGCFGFKFFPCTPIEAASCRDIIIDVHVIAVRYRLARADAEHHLRFRNHLHSPPLRLDSLHLRSF